LPTAKPWQAAYGVGLAIALWTYAGYEQLSTVIEPNRQSCGHDARRKNQAGEFRRTSRCDMALLDLLDTF
jgi:hypothetical protein